MKMRKLSDFYKGLDFCLIFKINFFSQVLIFKVVKIDFYAGLDARYFFPERTVWSNAQRARAKPLCSHLC